MQKIEISIRRADWADPDVPLPSPASTGAAGADVRAQLPSGPVTLAPGARLAIPTGFAIAIPPGWEVQLRPRSGLAARHGLTLLNAPGTIDSDFRGEVAVLMINQGHEPVEIAHGDRIAQAIAARVPQIDWIEKAELPHTERGTGGFGSTGRL